MFDTVPDGITRDVTAYLDTAGTTLVDVTARTHSMPERAEIGLGRELAHGLPTGRRIAYGFNEVGGRAWVTDAETLADVIAEADGRWLRHIWDPTVAV
ncbi:MAG: hypothetical protein AAF390_15565 [Pseudomonadota bacterium]